MSSNRQNTPNVKSSTEMLDYSDSDVRIEEEIAHNVVGLLNDRAQHLTAVEAESLASARNRAVNKLVSLQTQTETFNGVNQGGGVLQWFGHFAERHHAMSTALIIGAMLLVIFAVQRFELSKNLEAGDAFLLASDLPPEAYADKGFNMWVGIN